MIYPDHNLHELKTKVNEHQTKCGIQQEIDQVPTNKRTRTISEIIIKTNSENINQWSTIIIIIIIIYLPE